MDPQGGELTINYLMNRYALSFLNRQHSTNIQYAIENIQSLEYGDFFYFTFFGSQQIR